MIASSIFNAYIYVFVNGFPPEKEYNFEEDHYLLKHDPLEVKYPRIGDKVEVEEDIYAMTFCSYLMTDNERIKKPTWVMNEEETIEDNTVSQMRGELFSVCIMLIISQLLLIALIMTELREGFSD